MVDGGALVFVFVYVQQRLKCLLASDVDKLTTPSRLAREDAAAAAQSGHGTSQTSNPSLRPPLHIPALRSSRRAIAIRLLHAACLYPHSLVHVPDTTLLIQSAHGSLPRRRHPQSVNSRPALPPSCLFTTGYAVRAFQPLSEHPEASIEASAPMTGPPSD
jgi:hypothetical protein